MNVEHVESAARDTPFFPQLAKQEAHVRQRRYEPGGERRHAGRVESTGTVVVHMGDVAIKARILDLAVGGIRVHTAFAPQPHSRGTRVRIDLRVDGVGHWIHLHGHVDRVEDSAASSEIVIVLDHVPPSFEDLVQDELLASLECARTPHVLLVDAYRLRRGLVSDAFRVFGFHVIEASSPVEAIAYLGESQLHPWAIAIADSDVDASADELRRFMDDLYPCIPLIAIGHRRHTRSTTSLVVDQVPDLALQVLCLVGGDVRSVMHDRVR